MNATNVESCSVCHWRPCICELADPRLPATKADVANVLGKLAQLLERIERLECRLAPRPRDLRCVARYVCAGCGYEIWPSELFKRNNEAEWICPKCGGPFEIFGRPASS